MQEQSNEQITLFDIPTLVRAKMKRRTRSATRMGDPNIAGRTDRIDKRNRVMTARYYYHTEIRRIRFDDAIKTLSDCEFFLEERTITNALLACDDYYNELLREKTSVKKLQRIYSGFDWSM